VGEQGAKMRKRKRPKARCGNDAPCKAWKSPRTRATFPPFPPRLGIPPKRRGIPTFPQRRRRDSFPIKAPAGSSECPTPRKAEKALLLACTPRAGEGWNLGLTNKAHFPTSKAAQLAPYHMLGRLPQLISTHKFRRGANIISGEDEEEVTG
jgi:hypothetical protein